MLKIAKWNIRIGVLDNVIFDLFRFDDVLGHVTTF